MPSLETDAVRPFSLEEQDIFNARDNYGHSKLQCEETLKEYREKGTGPPYISFRLPDVVGARDNTHRWWTYQMWMKLQPVLETKITVPLYVANRQLSFVYVHDVADLIFNIVQNPPKGVEDETFNLAIREILNLTTVLTDIKNELGLENLDIPVIDNPQAFAFFPSVQLGPVNITKAETFLNWNPTEWSTIVKETVKFYENAMYKPFFQRSRNIMIRRFQMEFTSNPNDVINGLIDIYKINMQRPKDEL